MVDAPAGGDRCEILDVEQAGTHDALEVYAVVLVEALVFRRTKALMTSWARPGSGCKGAAHAHIRRAASVGGMHARHHRRLVVLQLGIVRQVLE